MFWLIKKNIPENVNRNIKAIKNEIKYKNKFNFIIKRGEVIYRLFKSFFQLYIFWREIKIVCAYTNLILEFLKHMKIADKYFLAYFSR